MVVDRRAVEAAAGLQSRPAVETLDELVDRLRADLVDYQSEKYARRFDETVAKARAAEHRLGPGTDFTEAVARNLHKLMAYKDEYEVARLLLDDEADAAYRAVGGDGTNVTYRLHPPMLRALGFDRKIELRRSAPAALRALRSMKGVRGRVADPFRWAEVRRIERAMIPEYVDAVDRLCDRLAGETVGESIAIASLPDQVRGYEDIKLRRAKAYRDELRKRLR